MSEIIDPSSVPFIFPYNDGQVEDNSLKQENQQPPLTGPTDEAGIGSTKSPLTRAEWK